MNTKFSKYFNARGAFYHKILTQSIFTTTHSHIPHYTPNGLKFHFTL